MSLTLQYWHKRIPVAKLQNSETIVYYSKDDDETHKKSFEFEEIDKYGYGRLVNIPVYRTLKNKGGRDIIYVCGKNGSGKSYYVGEYVKMYHSMYPEDRIICFSRLMSDETFQKLGIEKYLFRIHVDDAILENHFDLSDFKDSLVIMDDIESSQVSKVIIKYLHNLRDDLIENGRHFNINLLLTNHQIMNYKDTRTLLDECSSIVIFPNLNIPYQITRLLKAYFNFDNKQIKKIFNLNSRWVCLNLKYQFISYQHGIFMMNSEW